MENGKERLIPIDIKDVKMLDWLVDRAMVNRLWNEECSELRDLLKQVRSKFVLKSSFLNYKITL